MKKHQYQSSKFWKKEKDSLAQGTKLPSGIHAGIDITQKHQLGYKRKNSAATPDIIDEY